MFITYEVPHAHLHGFINKNYQTECQKNYRARCCYFMFNKRVSITAYFSKLYYGSPFQDPKVGDASTAFSSQI
jgi:hypothetical protein